MNDMNRGFPTAGVRYSPVLSPAGSPSERTMQGIFGALYASDSWKLFPGGDGKNENLSRSGSGSDLVQTAALRRELPELISRLGVRSFLDMPCGDFYWMSQVELGVDAYLGADIVPEVVEQNERKFGRPDRAFRVLDITRSRIPQVDMIFSRDCLVHFSNADVRAALRNVKRSGSTYFATTTFTGRADNADDIETGGWRSLNLCRAPFSLPAPLHLVNENCTEVYESDEDGARIEHRFADKSIGVWRTADL
ncbi:class I SAM-dependent methyltransferase [Streptomyces chrestomyceticus]|uniref:class I SAM-dependent methyltransferase n=1 Tax=Streptomyces chrestomyceticus TaxID=68185 RepID=UPI0033F0A732